MTRKTLLTITAVITVSIGTFALTLPGTLLEVVKHAAARDSANVMARTVGILLISVGVLDFLVRDHEDSPTLRAVLIANLVLQLGIMPIDPSAYVNGVYKTIGSFAPNTLLHVLLAAGFAYHLAKMKKKEHAPGVKNLLT